MDFCIFRSAIIAVLGTVLMIPGAFGQRTYSYIDENGVRILTNIPPKNPELLKKLAYTQDFSAPPPAAPSGKRAAESVDTIIEKYAPEYQLDPSLIRSMISQESGFNARAVSPKGAQGLMQLMPSTAARLGVRKVFDPEENIKGGMKHMRNLLDLFNNDLELSLAAYNAGENLVQKIGRIPNIRETHDYVRSIKQKFGSSKIAPFNVKSAEPERPRIYRYVDEKGVLHLESTPPVQREAQSGTSWTAGGQSLQ